MVAWLAQPSQVDGPLQAVMVCMRLVVMRRHVKQPPFRHHRSVGTQASGGHLLGILGEPPQVAGHPQAPMLCRRTGLFQGTLAQRFKGCPRSWAF